MKQILCTYERCGNKRVHWAMPNKIRTRRMIDVEDNHTGPMYCSMECAMYDGALTVRTKKENE